MKSAFLLLITIYIIILPISLSQENSNRNTNNNNKNSNNYNNNKYDLRRLLIKANKSRGEGLVTSEFVAKKVKVALSCEPEETIINLNFTEPFRGVVLAGDTNSRCRIRGDGQLAYVLRVPHNSCDTQHVIAKGSFINKLFIRYHPSLEMGGDHSKTIVCKFGTGSFNVS